MSNQPKSGCIYLLAMVWNYTEFHLVFRINMKYGGMDFPFLSQPKSGCIYLSAIDLEAYWIQCSIPNQLEIWWMQFIFGWFDKIGIGSLCVHRKDYIAKKILIVNLVKSSQIWVVITFSDWFGTKSNSVWCCDSVSLSASWK